MNKTKPLGLRQRIAQAETVEELEALVRVARAYEHASPHTLKRWFNTIVMRKKELVRGK